MSRYREDLMSEKHVMALHPEGSGWEATGDALAGQIEWEPANSGGAQGQRQRMVLAKGRVIIRRTLGAWLPIMLIGLLCCSLVALMLKEVVDPSLSTARRTGGLVLYALMLPVFILPLRTLLKRTRGMAFDKAGGRYFRAARYRHLEKSPASEQGRLGDIHALQVITEELSAKDSDGFREYWRSHELNLVLHSGERIHVMEHPHGREMREAAVALGEWLAVPVWMLSAGIE